MLTTNLRLNWVWSQPQERQLYRAIQSAHLIWGKRYPEWRDAFFDTYFLRTRVIPLFAEHPDAKPTLDPALLAQLWIDQFPGTEQRRHKLIAQLTPAVADLLQFIEAEQRYFASEDARRQAKVRHFWTHMPFSGWAERLLRRRSHTVPDCG